MPKAWDLDRLKAMSIHERGDLYKNASRLGHTPDGAALKKLIEEAGLPFSDSACLTNDDPITIKMYEIIFSKEGREAALAAILYIIYVILYIIYMILYIIYTILYIICS